MEGGGVHLVLQSWIHLCLQHSKHLSYLHTCIMLFYIFVCECITRCINAKGGLLCFEFYTNV